VEKDRLWRGQVIFHHNLPFELAAFERVYETYPVQALLDLVMMVFVTTWVMTLHLVEGVELVLVAAQELLEV